MDLMEYHSSTQYSMTTTSQMRSLTPGLSTVRVGAAVGAHWPRLNRHVPTCPYTDFVVPPRVRYDWTRSHGTHPFYILLPRTETIRYDWRPCRGGMNKH